MSKTQMMPQTYSELERWAAKVAGTDFVPKEYRGKPESVLICAQYALEIGLGIVEGLRSIAVINGKPSVYGDGLLALCQSSPVFEYCKEIPLLDDKGEIYGYVCEAKRKGQDAKQSRFTVEDARRAKLATKMGPWQEYPQRMLQMRARGFALRDVFADVLKGLISREEAEDYPTETITVEKPSLDPLESLLEVPTAPTITPDQAKHINELRFGAGISDVDWGKWLDRANAESTETLHPQYYVRICNALTQRIESQQK